MASWDVEQVTDTNCSAMESSAGFIVIPGRKTTGVRIWRMKIGDLFGKRLIKK